MEESGSIGPNSDPNRQVSEFFARTAQRPSSSVMISLTSTGGKNTETAP